MARPLLLLAVCVAASAFIRPVSHVRAARSIDVAAKKKRKGKPAAGGLQSLKVPQLKEKCRAAGLPVGGTKAVLIERLQSAGAAPAAAAAPAEPASDDAGSSSVSPSALSSASTSAARTSSSGGNAFEVSRKKRSKKSMVAAGNGPSLANQRLLQYVT